ncbi:uncharacterized protein BO80DRAFT_447165 [Aspergillus ibericus CBS 121593]|uniref:Uncharacterized protein n=1 Tax=Aspergillus ibericus CBS 121593 TaxID=1448316 RepID=A0A395GXL7_9EURO|nr:hypothetical protein BO80DRAFT_447165 [Aspergillus ibericus CBS 121593]RAK98803.1 hypothetical protein BO80DRAFT_447165 [Aspergillus ibericus CBS 121593]
MSSYTSSDFSRTSDHALSYSSPESEQSLFDANPETDKEGFLNSLHRAGGPYLCSLPAVSAILRKDSQTTPNNHALIEDIYVLQDNTRRILEEEGLSYKSVALVGRQSKIRPENSPIPTIVIDLERQQDDLKDWRKVSKLIYTNVASRHEGLSVELIDPAMEILPCCSPIQASDNIRLKWPSIRDQILEQMSIWEWTGLSLWRYGRNPDTSRNPVTIIICVRQDSTRTFHTDRRKIWAICAEHGERNVSILFMKDSLQRFCRQDCWSVPQLPLKACVATALPGVSLGIHQSTAGSSTLGGALELRFADQPGWQKYYTTCFHCVYPPPQHRETLLAINGAMQGFARWETNAPSFDDHVLPELLRIDHPSNSDLRQAVESEKASFEGFRDRRFTELESWVTALEEGEDAFITSKERKFYEKQRQRLDVVQNRLTTYERFLSNKVNILGKVVAGSGQWRAKERQIDGGIQQGLGIMDWALISALAPRIGSNKPFPYSEGAQAYDVVFFFSNSDRLEPDMRLFKSGRSTQNTEGRYAGVMQARIHRETNTQGERVPVVTYEHEISALYGKIFAEPGDSGSWIYTQNGAVVGMLIGGSERMNTFDFIEIGDLMRDIQVVTGALEVRVAED